MTTAQNPAAQIFKPMTIPLDDGVEPSTAAPKHLSPQGRVSFNRSEIFWVSPKCIIFRV
jgi:hypothetical protein